MGNTWRYVYLCLHIIQLCYNNFLQNCLESWISCTTRSDYTYIYVYICKKNCINILWRRKYKWNIHKSVYINNCNYYDHFWKCLNDLTVQVRFLSLLFTAHSLRNSITSEHGSLHSACAPLLLWEQRTCSPRFLRSQIQTWLKI